MKRGPAVRSPASGAIVPPAPPFSSVKISPTPGSLLTTKGGKFCSGSSNWGPTGITQAFIISVRAQGVRIRRLHAVKDVTGLAVCMGHANEDFPRFYDTLSR